MITGVSQVTIPVADRQRAKEFWTAKLGFAVHTDEPHGEERWIELAPPDGAPLLVVTDPSDDDTGRQDRSELPDSPVLFACDDIRRTYRELTRKGVRFSTPPQRMLFGWWAVFEGARYGLGEAE